MRETATASSALETEFRTGEVRGSDSAQQSESPQIAVIPSRYHRPVTLVALGPFSERLDATEISDADWGELRRSRTPLRCLGCGGGMHTKELAVSDPMPGESTSLRIFAHNPYEAIRCRALGFDESADHHRLKRLLARGARNAGWKAELEVQPSKDCRADVVATHPKGERTHAFEAQIATLNLPTALTRHQRYEKEFGNCTWTHTGRREWASQIPSLRVADDHETVVAGILVDLTEYVEAEPTPLLDVVPKVLDRSLLYVYDSGWGTYVLRDAMSRSPRRLPQRKHRKVSGVGAQRFCNRMASLSFEQRALALIGIRDEAEFTRKLAEAHEAFRAVGHAGLTDRHWEILALAGQFPALSTPATASTSVPRGDHRISAGRAGG
jgi:hypothetical protein